MTTTTAVRCLYCPGCGYFVAEHHPPDLLLVETAEAALIVSANFARLCCRWCGLTSETMRDGRHGGLRLVDVRRLRHNQQQNVYGPARQRPPRRN